jgi:hypothetical protein
VREIVTFLRQATGKSTEAAIQGTKARTSHNSRRWLGRESSPAHPLDPTSTDMDRDSRRTPTPRTSRWHCCSAAPRKVKNPAPEPVALPPAREGRPQLGARTSRPLARRGSSSATASVSISRRTRPTAGPVPRPVRQAKSAWTAPARAAVRRT